MKHDVRKCDKNVIPTSAPTANNEQTKPLLPKKFGITPFLQVIQSHHSLA